MFSPIRWSGYNLSMLAVMQPWQIVCVVLLGLIAGIGGGLLGVGGSIIMIPGLVLLFGQDRLEGFNQHLYQAAAMVANVAVAVPAAFRHYRAGTMAPKALRWMLPAALIAVLIGVRVSNLDLFQGTQGSIWLGRILAGFLIYVIYVNIMRLKPAGAARELNDKPHITPAPSATVGGVMGFIAGLLGIGGGAIAVPLQQMLMRITLRPAIANSSAIICVSAALGAFYKNASLDVHGLQWRDSLMLAAVLAPTCLVGGYLGASLTHRLPLRQVRIAFIIFMSIAAFRMANIPLPAFMS